MKWIQGESVLVILIWIVARININLPKLLTFGFIHLPFIMNELFSPYLVSKSVLTLGLFSSLNLISVKKQGLCYEQFVA